MFRLSIYAKSYESYFKNISTCTLKAICEKMRWPWATA